MITSKQRAKLRSMATKIEPIVQIGYKELNDNLLLQIDGALESRELIKISILQSADVDGKTLVNELANVLHAEPITSIGSKMVLYRKSKKKGVNHIEID